MKYVDGNEYFDISVQQGKCALKIPFFLMKIVSSILSNDIISGVEGGFDSLDTANLPTGTCKTCMHTHTYKILLINLGIN